MTTKQAAPTLFEPVWDDPSDATHFWRRSWETPMKRLHQDAIRSYYEGERRCWESCGSPLAREHVVRFLHGWTYVRGPEMDEAAGARLGALAAHRAAFAAHGLVLLGA